MAYIISSGDLENGIILENNSMTVLDGGTANSTTVNSGGSMWVSSGGTANSTTVSGGSMWVSSGGTANSTTINSGGSLYVFFGGVADSTTVNSGGNLYVSNGGTVGNTTVNSGGGMYVSSGGTANSTMVSSGGYLYVSSGGTADDTTVNSGGSLFIKSGGTADSTIMSDGNLYVSNGGTADNTIMSGGYIYVSSGGTAIGIIMSGGSLIVSSGGTAENIDWTPCEGHVFVINGGVVTFVNSYSGVYFGSDNKLLSHAAAMESKEVKDKREMNVMSGGMASKTMVGTDGVLYISSGASADGTIISGGNLYVSNGGTADNTIMNGGNLRVSNGGTADNTFMNGGTLYVLSGGTATNIVWTPCEGGHVNVSDGGYVTFVSEYLGVYYGSNGHLLSSAATMVPMTIGVAEEMNVMSGGTAVGATVSSSGNLYVFSGGTANSTTLFNGGSLKLSSGATLNNTTINSGYKFSVSSGITVNNTTVSSGGAMSILRGGSADIITIKANARLDIDSGGIANNPTVAPRGSLYIKSGGTATDIVWTPFTGATLDVRDGAVVTFSNECAGVYYGRDNSLISHAATVMENQEINEKYEMIVIYGGTARNTKVNSGGKLRIFNGGTANDTRVSAYGWLYVSSGGVANGTVMDSGGEFHVSNGGTANETVIYNWGSMYVSSGGTAKNTIVCSGGSFIISKGGSANHTTVDFEGKVSLSESGTVDNTTINDGWVYIRKGATANSTVINSKGRVEISESGTANNTTVSSGGQLSIKKGGMANSVTVNSGGSLTIVNGGILTGRIIHFGGVISAFEGAILDFDLTQIAPGEGARISDFAGIKGTPTWTITVNADQTEGIYFLAGSAAGFDQTISVMNKSGDELGTLTVGETTAISDIDYTLSLSDDGMLFLNIGDVLPPPPYTSIGLILGQGSASVESGEVFYDTLIGPDGQFFVNDGGMASSTIVSGGKTTIIGSGTADTTMVYSGGKLAVIGSGTADNTTIYSNGSFIVSGGGMASNTIVSGGGFEVSDGLADSTTVYTGNMLVSAKGLAANTTVFSGGVLDVNGGTANSTTVNSGGSCVASSGGRLTGRMNFENGAVVSASVGAFFDFDLRQASPGDAPLVNDLSIVKGTPFYTITVDGTQNTGTYRLANGVSVFNNVISIMNAEREQIGSLLVGQKLETKYADYTLKVTKGSLTVTVSVPGSGVVPPAEDTAAPTAPSGLMPVVDGQNVALLWNESTDDTGVKEYIVNYSLDGEIFTARTTIPHYVLKDVDYGTWNWSVQAVDFAGNSSAVTVGDAFTVTSFKPYKVEYSADNFEHAIRFTVTTPALNAFRMPGGTYQMRVMATDSSEWTEGDSIEADEFDNTPQIIKSDADGNADVFFANPIGTWESGYVAQHVGSINDWCGTNEYATLYVKNKLADIIEGSTDANILLMTDDANGDALFVDDIYTASPGNIAEKQSRIAQIDEIRAGAGNDIVDMTSQRFEYNGDGLTIRGGDGNDVIWANKGDNMLFGDAGNDRIVGASGDDVIIGGIGNDSMHGGGGDDVFTFCDNWDADTVEQLEDGLVTLWFASGSEENWNAETLTYTDGANSVTVSGVIAEQITLRFGAEKEEDAERFAMLSGAGAFDGFTSQRVFEESYSGLIASL